MHSWLYLTTLHRSKPRVTFTDAEMVYHLGGTLDCANCEIARINLLNDSLKKEVIELRVVHINQDKLKEQVAFLEHRVNLYKQLEINLKEIITGLETKVRGYYNSGVKAKEFFNQIAINQTVGIGFDYNEAEGKLSINTPNRVSVEDRGIPHVLKGVEKPFFRKSIREPFNEASIFIQEEMRTEDISNENVMPNKSVPEESVKVVPTTETNSDTDKLEQKDNMSNMHNMPKVDISHAACGVVNCMSYAFNVMYVYFNSEHASSDKTAPRQHMNNKKHVKSKTVPSKILNNVKHANNKVVLPQHLINAKNVKSKTVSPPKSRVETFVPKPKLKFVKAVYKVKSSVNEKFNVEKVNVVKTMTASPLQVKEETFVPKSKQKSIKTVYVANPKQKSVKAGCVPKPKQNVVKAVYKVKCSVTEKIDHVVQVKNVILSGKGQFFKYVEPNQVWVPKKV